MSNPDPNSNPTGGLNMSVEINGGQNLVGQNTIAGGVNQFVGQAPTTARQVYDVIRKALPQQDTDAIAAANYLETQEAEIGDETRSSQQEPPEAVHQSQTLLARYREPILTALKEMGLLWLRAAVPQVVFVEPLIRMAIHALQHQES